MVRVRALSNISRPKSTKHLIILQHFIFTRTIMHLSVISFRMFIVRIPICCLTPTLQGELGSQPHGCVTRRVCRPSKRAENTFEFPQHLSFTPLEKLSLTTERSNSPETGVVFHSGLQTQNERQRIPNPLFTQTILQYRNTFISLLWTSTYHIR